MSKRSKNFLVIGFIAILFVVGFIGFKDSLPQEKNNNVYAALQEYFPYTIEKRFGGLSIVFKDGREKEKPSNSDIFHVTDKLEKDWGKDHLKVENNILIILNEQKEEIKKIELNSEEISWVKSYFEI